MDLATLFLRPDGVLVLHHYGNNVDTTRIIHAATCHSFFSKNVKYWNCKQVVRFGALEEVFMSYRPHGAWRTMEVLEELA
jgi:hypothetical protein